VPNYWDTIPLQYFWTNCKRDCSARHLPAYPCRPLVMLCSLTSLPTSTCTHYLSTVNKSTGLALRFHGHHEFSCKLKTECVHYRSCTHPLMWSHSGRVDQVRLRVRTVDVGLCPCPTTPDGLAAFLLIQFRAFSSETSSQPTFWLF